MRRIVSRSFIPNRGGCDACVGGSPPTERGIVLGLAAVLAGTAALFVRPVLGGSLVILGAYALNRHGGTS